MSIEIVAMKMAKSAEILPNGTGLYYGSPRPLMEVPGVSVSNGKAYRNLKAMGIQAIRNGKNGLWLIPSDLMKRYVS